MKKKLLFFIVLLTSIATNSQVTRKVDDKQTLIGSRYLFTETLTISKSDAKTANDFDIEKDYYVEIISENADNVTFVNVVPKNVADDSVDMIDTAPKTLPKYLFFYYTKQQFSQYKGAGVGLYTVPFKIRPGKNFDFEAALSLATNIVFGFGHKDNTESWLDASVGIGVTSISLTQDNSKVTENRTATALTLSGGTVFKVGTNANIGLFLGGDFLNGNDKKTDWIYNGNLWIGVGINVNLTKVETNQSSEKSKKYNEILRTKKVKFN